MRVEERDKRTRKLHMRRGSVTKRELSREKNKKGKIRVQRT